MYYGRGRRLRIAGWTDRRGIMGARFAVTTDAPDAVAQASAALKRARFTPMQRHLSEKLAALGSEWVAEGLGIGRSISNVWFGGSSRVDAEFFPLNLIPLFWPRVATTLAIACARPMDAVTELVIFAHPSMLRAGDRTNDSRPLMERACTDLQRRFAASGALLSYEPLVDFAALRAAVDENCPASGAFVRHELDWR